MNYLTAFFLCLAAVSLLLPSPQIGSGRRVCVKAFIGDTMFNKHTTMPEVPRAGDEVGFKNYVQRVACVRWTESGTALVFLEHEHGSEAEPKLIEAGFLKLVQTSKE